MRFFKLLAPALFIGSIAFGQTLSIKGTVSDKQGNPVPVAFIRDAKHSYATYADSAGQFRLAADPASTLIVTTRAGGQAVVKIDGKTTINLVLDNSKQAGNMNGANRSGGAGSANDSFLNRQLLVSQSSPYNTAVKAGFNQEETRGSRYLYTSWLPGYGVSKGDSVIQDWNNVYNYDKVNGQLLFTQDRNTMSRISPQQVKSFTLFDGAGHPHVYESVPEMSDKAFVEVLGSTPKYKIVKRVDTKLLRADFHTDGVIESGHKYDEYIDSEHYYFIKLPNGQPESFSLRKGTIKKLFGGDADKFINTQGSRDIDDNYLRDLVESLTP